ncbi:MAG: hypothetical protein ABIU29_01585 [Chthoniobacterales bacterium]
MLAILRKKYLMIGATRTARSNGETLAASFAPGVWLSEGRLDPGHFQRGPRAFEFFEGRTSMICMAANVQAPLLNSRTKIPTVEVDLAFSVGKGTNRLPAIRL